MDNYKHLTLIKAGKTIKQEEETNDLPKEDNFLTAYFNLIKRENEILVKRIELLEAQNRNNIKYN